MGGFWRVRLRDAKSAEREWGVRQWGAMEYGIRGRRLLTEGVLICCLTPFTAGHFALSLDLKTYNCRNAVKQMLYITIH